MNMSNSKVKVTLLTLTLCLALALTISVFLGAVDEPALEGTPISDFSELGTEILAFNETDDSLLLITSDETQSHLLKLNKSTGETLSHTELDYPAREALPVGRGFFIFREDDASTTLTEFSNELKIVNETTYPVNIGELAFYAVTENGICFTQMDTRNVLEIISSTGETETIPFETEIEFLETAPDGAVYLYADNSLFRLDGTSLVELDYSICPVKFLDSKHFIDSNHYLCKIKENGVEMLLECSAAYNYEFAAMSANGEEVILSQSTDKLSVFDFSGEIIGNLTVNGKLLTVTPSGALFEKDFTFFYAPHSFTEPEPEPIPESIIYSTDDWIAEPQLGIIEVRKGLDASGLIAAFRPYAETVRTTEGVEIVSGKLATGMKIGDYDIVVRGDCSGNGEVNGTDILQLQAVMVYLEDISGVYRIAADVDADGELTTLDLVWMAKIKNNKVEPQLRYKVDWSEVKIKQKNN